MAIESATRERARSDWGAPGRRGVDCDFDPDFDPDFDFDFDGIRGRAGLTGPGADGAGVRPRPINPIDPLSSARAMAVARTPLRRPVHEPIRDDIGIFRAPARALDGPVAGPTVGAVAPVGAGSSRCRVVPTNHAGTRKRRAGGDPATLVTDGD